MAVTATRVNWRDGGGAALPFGDRWAIQTSVAFDSSYPTGGEALTYADLGFAARPDIVQAVSGRLGYQFDYDYTNQKILAYWGDLDAVADGPLVEVTDTTTLVGLTAVVFLAYGKYKI